MLHDAASGLLAGALVLGAVHGAEPGHGWPIAAAYAFDRANAWLAGLVAGLVIGVGHLVSSLAVVGVFFLLKSRLPIEGLSEPLTVAGVPIGSPIGVVAGLLLVLLGVREYRGGGHGHSHGTDGEHGHGDGQARDHDEPHGHSNAGGTGSGVGRLHPDVDATRRADTAGRDRGNDRGRTHGTDHGHAHDDGSVLTRLRAAFPLVGGGGHGHDHGHSHDHGLSADEGLYGIAASAFVLGFAHEEEFEIIAICAGSDHCLGLMLAYAGTVIAVITALTLALVAGYERFEERMERYAEHFPTVSAVVLVVIGVGFLLGLL